MKIDALTSQRSMPTIEHDSAARGVQSADTDFSAELSDQQEAMSDEQMQELLRQIDEQGARLTKTP